MNFLIAGLDILDADLEMDMPVGCVSDVMGVKTRGLMARAPGSCGLERVGFPRQSIRSGAWIHYGQLGVVVLVAWTVPPALTAW